MNINSLKTNFLSKDIFVTILPIAALLLAITILSLAAILTRLSEGDIGPNATVFNRHWIAVLCLSLWEGSRGLISRMNRLGKHYSYGNSYNKQDICLLILMPIVGLLGLDLWAWSLTKTTVANSNLLHNLTPIFAALGAWLFLRQQFGYQFILGLVLALAGTVAIGWNDFRLEPGYLFGDSLALSSAIFYAGVLLVREELRFKFSVTIILFWNSLLSSLLILPVVIFTENQLFPSSQTGWLAVLGLGILCQLVGHGILTYSLKTFSSAFVSLFLLIEPLITALLAWKIFAEHLNPLNWIAFLGVLVGIFIAKRSQSSANWEK